MWQEAYRKLFKHAGIPGHLQRLRHTFAKNLLVSEVPLETVSLLLGHKKLAITEKHYARFVPERQALIDLPNSGNLGTLRTQLKLTAQITL